MRTWWLVALAGCGPQADSDTGTPPDAIPALEDHLQAFADARYPEALSFTVVASTVVGSEADPETLADEFVASATSIVDGVFVPWQGDPSAYRADVVLPRIIDGATVVRLDWTLGEGAVTTWAIVDPDVPATGDPVGFFEPITSTWRTPATGTGLLVAYEDGWGTVRARVEGALTCSGTATCGISVAASDDVPGCGADATAVASCAPTGCEADVTFLGWCGAASGFGRVYADLALGPTLSCGCGVHEDFDGDGLSPEAGYCNDGASAVRPGAAEACDTVDSDCDTSLVDTWPNFDGDALPDCVDPDDDDDGDPDLTDCDGMNTAFHAGAAESCDAIDHDCDDSLVDEFTDTNDDLEPDCTDSDDDGDEDPDLADCAPTNGAIHHGATEACDDVDSDCDADKVDGFANFDADALPDCADPDDDDDLDPDATDCDDKNNDAFHGALEVCDGVDDDCDGSSADGCWTLSTTDHVMTTARGGTGGTAFAANCAAGSVAVGFMGRSFSLVDAVALECAPLAGDGTIGNYTVTTMYGGTGGIVFVGTCTDHKLLTTLDTRAASLLDKVGGVCSFPDGSSTTNLAGWGGTGGTAFTDKCPAGYVGTGLAGRADSAGVVHQLQLRCSRLSKT